MDFDEILGPGSTQLSAGETQLVGWSRALFKEPKVLLIDEACSYLDQPKKSFVLQKVNEIKKHTLILMVSHDQSVMDQADRVIHL